MRNLNDVWKRLRIESESQTKLSSPLDLQTLEQRILYDGSPLGVVASSDDADLGGAVVSELESLSQELVFVTSDPTVVEFSQSQLDEESTTQEFLSSQELNAISGDEVEGIQSQLDRFESLVNDAIVEDEMSSDISDDQPEQDSSDTQPALPTLVSKARVAVNALEIQVNEGSLSEINATEDVITSDELRTFSTDSGGDIIYSLIDGPQEGEIIVEQAVVDQFTQAQIDAGIVRYSNPDGVGDDSFTFSVTDGTGNFLMDRFIFNSGRDNETPLLEGIENDGRQVAVHTDTLPIPVDFGQDATVNDTQSTFQQGFLEFRISDQTVSPNDVFEIISGEGIEVDPDGLRVRSQGIVIGEIERGQGLLRINFNLFSDADEVSALIHRVHFSNSNLSTVATGDRDITITVGDGNGASDSRDLTITLLPPNVAPNTFDSSAVGTQGQADPIVLELSAIDVDGEVASFRYSAGTTNGSLYLDPSQTTLLTVGDVFSGNELTQLYFVPDADFDGSVQLAFSAIDDDGLEDLTPALLTVEVQSNAEFVNTGLVVDPFGTNLITSNELSYLNSEADPADIRYEITQQPSNAQIFRQSGAFAGRASFFTQDDLDNGRISVFPSAGSTDDSQIVFNVIVSGEVVAVGQTFDLIQVDNANTPPDISVGEDQITLVNTLLRFNPGLGNEIVISDADSRDNSFSVSINASSGFLGFLNEPNAEPQTIADAPFTIDITGTLVDINSRLEQLYFRPAEDFIGTVGVEVVVNDGGNNNGQNPSEVSDFLSIAVRPTQEVPVLTEGCFHGLEDRAPVAIELQNEAAGDLFDGFRIIGLPSNGDLFTDAALTNPVLLGDVIAADSVGPELFFRSHLNFSGTTEFTVVGVNDTGQQISNVARQTIEISPINDAPVIDLDGDNDSVQSSGVNRIEFREGEGPVLIADPTDLMIDDVDSNTFVSLTVRVSSPNGEPAGTIVFDMSGSPLNVDQIEDGLVFSGEFPSLDYETVLSNLRFDFTDNFVDGEQRIITVVVNDGESDSETTEVIVTLVARPDGPLSQIANVPGFVQVGRDDAILADELNYNTPSGLAADRIVYQVVTSPEFGFLMIDSEPVESFTQQDINEGRLIYRHSSLEETNDEFVFTVTDGFNTLTNQTYEILAGQSNSRPVISSQPAFNINENVDTAATPVVAFQLTITNPNIFFGDTLTWSIVGGSDADRFSLAGANLDQLVFNDGLVDFERQSTYSVLVQVVDSRGASSTRLLNVEVIDQNEAPVVVSPNPIELSESTDVSVSRSVFTIQAEDPEDDLLTYVLGDGDPGFSLGGVGGNEVFFQNDQLDFETIDRFETEIGVLDSAGNESIVSVQIDITDVNEAPVILGPFETTLSENQDLSNGVSVFTLNTTDVDSDSSVFSVISSDGDAVFTIGGPQNNELIIQRDTPFDFETDPQSLSVVIEADDGAGGVDRQTFVINVADVNEAPEFLIDSDVISTPENSSGAFVQVGAVDPEGGLVSFSLLGSADAGLFSIDETGNLSFVGAPDFESPQDSDSNNTYDVTIIAEDVQGLQRLQNLQITVTDVNEPPAVSTTAFSIPENEQLVGGVTATDPEGAELTFSLDRIVSGVPFPITDGDTLLFSITPSGQLSFLTPPNFENPTDADGDNRYSVTVAVVDEQGTQSFQTIEVSVVPTNEAPIIVEVLPVGNAEDTVQIVAVDDDTDNLTFSIEDGLDAEFFQIDQQGNLSFNQSPNFAIPQDSDRDNVYRVAVNVSDGVLETRREVVFEVAIEQDDLIPVLIPDSTFDQEQIGDDIDDSVTLDDEVGQEETSDSISDSTSDDQVETDIRGISTMVKTRDSGQVGVNGTVESLKQFIADDIASESSAFQSEAAAAFEYSKHSVLAILTHQQDIQLREITAMEGLDELIATQSASGLAFIYDLRSLEADGQNENGLSNLLDLKFTFGAVTAVGTLGYILWSIRSGMLVAFALTQLPTWQMIDPLPVLETYETKLKKADDTIAGKLFS